MNSTPSFIVDIIKRDWAPGKKILEIGCGPAFLREFFKKDYIGVDITDEPYNKDLLRNVDIICSAENLLVESDSVDIIVIKSSFYLFADHSKALKEAKRVLKSKGAIIIFDYNRKTQKRLQKNDLEKVYPCWTQWGLKRKLEQSGYDDCAIISHKIKVNLCQIIMNEIRGDWAIARGSKP